MVAQINTAAVTKVSVTTRLPAWEDDTGGVDDMDNDGEVDLSNMRSKAIGHHGYEQ